MTNSPPAATQSLFDRIRWRDPVSGLPLEPLITARNPAGVPLCGALRVTGTDRGYPIVGAVARLSLDSARRHQRWLEPFGLRPPEAASGQSFQPEDTVDSFGFQWAWNAAMRTEEDLRWRVAERFKVAPEEFAGRLVMDAGAGAGDQSRWLLDHGAQVLSVDLSSAIDVVASKLSLRPEWFGVQGDITALPLESDQFERVYCEGVIQHTRDSALTVRELARVLTPGGLLLSTHYELPGSLGARLRSALTGQLRERLSRLDRYPLLLVTGNLAFLAYLPVVGPLVRKSGLAMHYALQPDFRTTWTNTFDAYGNHSFQRFVSGEEFWSYFEQAGGLEKVLGEGTVVVARKLPAAAA